ncbi:MAG: mechanosensitive ion channel domain-containing protein [Acidimicrobiia bacterium]
MEFSEDVLSRTLTSAVVIVGGIVVALLLERAVGSRVEDDYERFYARKFIRYGSTAAVFVILLVVWQPFGAGIATALGLAAAGLTFAMQEVIGAFAGWFNITLGRIFRIGDRIEMAGVSGDVIDITPLRTKLMEIGSATDDTTWVKGRQHTGRMVAISNKATFTDPVYNFSSFFDFIWEEMAVLVPFHEDRDAAMAILAEEAEELSQVDEALEQMRQLRRRFPVPDAELVPRVFASIADAGMVLSARFIVPTRTARSVKDQLARRVEKRFTAAGIELIVTDVLQTGPDWGPVSDDGRWADERSGATD